MKQFVVLAILCTCDSAPVDWPVVAVGNAKVQIAVEGKSAFRLSISYDGAPQQMASRMIAEKGETAEYQKQTKEDQGGHTIIASLRTAFGDVSINVAGDFVLHDDQGKPLLSTTVSALASYDSTQDELHVLLSTPPGTAAPRKWYGAGYKPGSPLETDKSNPSVGNDYGKGAWSWAPQYWSRTDTYAALGVSRYDLFDTDPSAGRCVGETTGRQDCGFYGITQSQCEAKNCCWGPTNETLPWCYSKTSPSLANYPAIWIGYENGVQWTFRGPVADIYLMPALDAYEFRKCHAQLTGAPSIIPLYAFGFMAGRWGWVDKADIESKLQQFRSGNYPIDAFISDFEWFTTSNDYGLPPEGSQDYTDFGYNSGTFPDPKVQLELYHQMGFKFGGIRKPRLGNTELLNTCRENGWLVPGGVDGKDRNMNYSIKAARDWYADQNQHYLDDGVDFWWNDEGEVTYFMFDEWNDALASGVKKKASDKRYFSINRAYTPGMQKYGLAIWTGDIAVSWESMAEQPAAMLNAELMGMPYVGCDTGGFKGGDDTPEMMTRWYQLAAFMSIMRVHSNNQQTPHFPFLYGKEAGDAMRKVLELRYHIIPTLYSLAHFSRTDGAPINRPLFMEFPDDDKAWTITSQWLVGTGLMAAPIMAQGGSRSVYFPTGAVKDGATSWYDFNASTVHAGGTTLDLKNMALDVVPLYCREGTVLPLAPKVINTEALPGGPLEVHIYAGTDGEFTFVEDDGATTAYTVDEKKYTRRTVFRWEDGKNTLHMEVQGNFVADTVFRSFIFKKFNPDGPEAPPQIIKSDAFLKDGETYDITFIHKDKTDFKSLFDKLIV